MRVNKQHYCQQNWQPPQGSILLLLMHATRLDLTRKDCSFAQTQINVLVFYKWICFVLFGYRSVNWGRAYLFFSPCNSAKQINVFVSCCIYLFLKNSTPSKTLLTKNYFVYRSFTIKASRNYSSAALCDKSLKTKNLFSLADAVLWQSIFSVLLVGGGGVKPTWPYVKRLPHPDLIRPIKSMHHSNESCLMVKATADWRRHKGSPPICQNTQTCRTSWLSPRPVFVFHSESIIPTKQSNEVGVE